MSDASHKTSEKNQIYKVERNSHRCKYLQSTYLPILLCEQRRSSACAKIPKQNRNCAIQVKTDISVKSIEQTGEVSKNYITQNGRIIPQFAQTT